MNNVIGAQNMITYFLQPLLLQIQSILSDKFVGLYIGGSIATNSFNDETSDIDCYIITATSLSENVINQIEEMHKQFYSSAHPYAQKIEASYIVKNDLVNINPNNTRPYFNEGKFYLAPYGNNFTIELFVLKKYGITVHGLQINALIKDISDHDLKMAINKNLDEYWKPMLNNLEKLKRDDYQIFAILTMCRTLYSLETGLITSKIDAAHWAIKNVNGSWKGLIEKALAWRSHHVFNKLEETRQLIEYVVSKNCAI